MNAKLPQRREGFGNRRQQTIWRDGARTVVIQNWPISVGEGVCELQIECACGAYHECRYGERRDSAPLHQWIKERGVDCSLSVAV
jgi:hypothetical protein